RPHPAGEVQPTLRRLPRRSYDVVFRTARPWRERPMSEASPPTPPDLLRQLRQHLESLRAAGVDWLPSAPVPEASPPAPAAPGPAFQASLFSAGKDLAARPADAEGDKRRHELKVLAERVAGCQRCPELAATRRQTVFGVGRLGAELCFVGEAPGRDEDAQGEPFVGAAGQLLNRIIAACGM